jgi:hypothetical protein
VAHHHDMKRVDAANRVGNAVGGRPGDPASHVTRHQPDLFAARLVDLITSENASTVFGYTPTSCTALHAHRPDADRDDTGWTDHVGLKLSG